MLGKTRGWISELGEKKLSVMILYLSATGKGVGGGGGDSKFSKIANFVQYVRFHRLFPPGIFNFVPFILQSPWLARGFRP